MVYNKIMVYNPGKCKYICVGQKGGDMKLRTQAELEVIGKNFVY